MLANFPFFIKGYHCLCIIYYIISTKIRIKFLFVCNYTINFSITSIYTNYLVHLIQFLSPEFSQTWFPWEDSEDSSLMFLSLSLYGLYFIFFGLTDLVGILKGDSCLPFLRGPSSDYSGISFPCETSYQTWKMIYISILIS